jgi:hypothetical protein
MTASSFKETEQKVGDKIVQIQYEKGDEVTKENQNSPKDLSP